MQPTKTKQLRNQFDSWLFDWKGLIREIADHELDVEVRRPGRDRLVISAEEKRLAAKEKWLVSRLAGIESQAGRLNNRSARGLRRRIVAWSKENTESVRRRRITKAKKKQFYDGMIFYASKDAVGRGLDDIPTDVLKEIEEVSAAYNAKIDHQASAHEGF